MTPEEFQALSPEEQQEALKRMKKVIVKKMAMKIAIGITVTVVTHFVAEAIIAACEKKPQEVEATPEEES